MLTEKKRLYAVARESGKSIKDSAIWAGCPEKTAAQAGSRMEKDADVIACRARLKSGDSSHGKEPEKPKALKEVAPTSELTTTDDPIKFMAQIMNDGLQDPRLRLDAAKALASFTVAKPGEKGKKQGKQERAESTAKGRFGAAPPPLKRVK